MRRYKIKYRSPQYDSIAVSGWYIYSRLYARRKDGGPAYRRYRMAGPFASKADAQAKAAIMSLKFNELAKRMQSENRNYPES